MVSARITHREGVFQTIDHKIIDEYDELAISAGVYNRQKTDFVAVGQIRDALDYMVSYAPGWSSVEKNLLRAVWKAYHLNGMRASCVHQEVMSDSPCPEGYKQGSVWLVSLLPAWVPETVASLFI